jgi:hypothetical protein
MIHSSSSSIGKMAINCYFRVVVCYAKTRHTFGTFANPKPQADTLACKRAKFSKS